MSAIGTNHLDGEVWECGVYRGGSAMELLKIIGPTTLRLFDTFGGGIPRIGDEPKLHGRFAITEAEFEAIRALQDAHDNVCIHEGIIPNTFFGLEGSQIRLAHIDVDSGLAYHGCLDFIWPRLVKGGIMVLDDYGANGCDGATEVTNAFVAAHDIMLHKTEGWGAWIMKIK